MLAIYSAISYQFPSVHIYNQPASRKAVLLWLLLSFFFLNSFSIPILRSFNIFCYYLIHLTSLYIFFFGNHEWVSHIPPSDLCLQQLSAIHSWWTDSWFFLATVSFLFANTPLNLFAWSLLQIIFLTIWSLSLPMSLYFVWKQKSYRNFENTVKF